MKLFRLAALFAALSVPALAGPPAQIVPVSPSLGPNTFTGTQTAPSFLGDVSSATSTATGGNTPLTAADRAGLWTINVRDFGAQANALGGIDGTISASGTTFTSATAHFASTDCSLLLHPAAGCTGVADKSIQIDGLISVGGAPLVTTIVGYNSATSVKIGTAATVAAPQYFLSAPTVAAQGSAGGSYLPGETVPCGSGGTFSTACTINVLDTLVRSVAVSAAGTGGTTGACTLTGTTGVGTVATYTATISGGAISGTPTIANSGHYFTNPNDEGTPEPVTSNCGLIGATLTQHMGIDRSAVTIAGAYTVKPTNPVTPGAGNSSGATGNTLTLSFLPTGSYTYATDDSAAFVSAFNRLISLWGAGQPACVYAPQGSYYINANALPLFNQVPGCIKGDGHTKTNLIVGASYSGDLFSWSEAWLMDGPYNGSTPTPTAMIVAPIVQGLSIYGDRLAAAQQNAMVFYDREDSVFVDDVDVLYLNGRAIYSGVTKNKTQSYMRESRFDRFRAFNDGQSGVPVVEFNSVGTGDSTNEIEMGQIDIYAPYGPGFVIRNNSSGGVRAFRIAQLRIEGLEGNVANIAGDLLTIGDPNFTGIVDNISIDQLEAVDPYNGYAAIRTTAPNSSSQPYQINIGGTSGSANSVIGGGLPLGYGIKVDAGRSLYFHIYGMNTWNTNVSVAATPTVGSGNIYDGNGSESSWTWVTDSSSITTIGGIVRKYGRPDGTVESQNAAISVYQPDGSPQHGNAGGAGSVNFQAFPSGAANVASGLEAAIINGTGNKAAGPHSITGGFFNQLTGDGTVGFGARISDRGLASGFYTASACQPFNIIGACQSEVHTFGGTTASITPFRLTSNQIAANSSNCLNIPAGTVETVAIDIAAHDRTTTGSFASWNTLHGVLSRGSGNVAYAGDASVATTPNNSSGAGATATIQISADTTNQCLNITWVSPNTDIWDETAVIRGALSQ